MRRLTVVLAFAMLVGTGWFVKPAEGSPVQTAAKVYSSKCSGCHAPDGTGNITGTPNFTNAEWQASVTDDQLTASIKNGKGKIMPSWSGKLTDAQIAELVQHVRAFKK